MTLYKSGINAETDELLDLLADEFSLRISRGEQLDIEEYALQYPQLAQVIRELFPALAALAALPDDHIDANTHETQSGRVIGDFRLVRQIGRGGMGIVYEAEQISLQRRVALKILPFAAVLDPRQLQRFKNEAQAAAGLHHAHIVPVHSVGTDRGVHFYAMQFVDGQDLSTVLKAMRLAKVDGKIAELPNPTRVAEKSTPDQPSHCDIVLDLNAAGAELQSGELINDSPQTEPAIPAADTQPVNQFSTASLHDRRERFRTIAKLGIQAAEALNYAHERGIVHRDIKPSNLLIDGEGELWITDFGLAQMETENGLTLTGDFVGTLQYMSPEQALGQRGVVDHRTDIYALGVTLYELLTCEPMLPVADKAELLKKIADEDPPHPSSIDRSIPDDLETIVLKAIAKEPLERYQTAGEMAEDLRSFLELKPIRAKRPGAWDRLTKWSRRNHSLVLSIAAVLFLAVLGLSAGTYFVVTAYEAESEQRRFAELETRRADVNLMRAMQAVTAMLTEVASKEIAELPQMEQVRRGLLRKAVTFHESLLAEQDDDPAIRYETAMAYVRMTNIHEQLGEFAQAEETGERAINLLLGLIESAPMNAQYRSSLAEAYEYVGLAQFQSRPLRIDAAVNTCRLQLEISKKLVQDFPGNLIFRRRLAENLTDMGNFLGSNRRLEEAESYLSESVQLWDDMIVEHPELAEDPEQAHSHQWLGGAFLKRRQFDDAERELLYANRIYEKTVNQEPLNTEYRGRLAHNRSYLANLYYFRGDYARSAEYQQSAMQLREQLAQEFPHVYEHKRLLAACYFNAARLFQHEGRFAEAQTFLIKQVDLQKEMALRFPQMPQRLGPIAWPLFDLGMYLYDAGKIPDARERFMEALNLFEQDAHEYPESFKAQHWYSWVLITCPIVELQNTERALLHAKKACELDPDDIDALCVLGVIEQRRGNLPIAQKILRETLKTGKKDVIPASAYTLALIEYEQGRPAEAKRYFQQAVKWQESYPSPPLELKWAHQKVAKLLGFETAQQ